MTMSNQKKKTRQSFTVAQKNQFVKMIIEDGLTVKKVMEISGASLSALTRWKNQYLKEINGVTLEGKIPLEETKREIYELKKQLAEAHKDIILLKKANNLIHTRQSRIDLIKTMIKAEPNLPTERLCSLIEVPVSSFYYKPNENQENIEITKKIIQIHHDNFERFGKRRIQAELEKQGIIIGVHRVSSLMKKAGIYAKLGKK